MSKHHIEKITCPKCEAESDFVIWDSINTMLNPEMKDKILNGEAFKWECPHCGHKMKVLHHILYHQMEDDIMIYYVPGDKTEAIELMKGIFRDVDGGILALEEELKPFANYRNRVVGTPNELIEKIQIFDEGLDDRVIELMKLNIVGTLQENDSNLSIKEFLFMANKDGKRGFAVNLGDRKWGEICFEQNMYDSIAKNMKDINENDDEVVINFKWALSAMGLV